MACAEPFTNSISLRLHDWHLLCCNWQWTFSLETRVLGNFFDPMMSITVITQITVAISWLNYTNYANYASYSDYANYGAYIWRGEIWITWLRQLRRHFFSRRKISITWSQWVIEIFQPNYANNSDYANYGGSFFPKNISTTWSQRA